MEECVVPTTCRRQAWLASTFLEPSQGNKAFPQSVLQDNRDWRCCFRLGWGSSDRYYAAKQERMHHQLTTELGRHWGYIIIVDSEDPWSGLATKRQWEDHLTCWDRHIPPLAQGSLINTVHSATGVNVFIAMHLSGMTVTMTNSNANSTWERVHHRAILQMVGPNGNAFPDDTLCILKQEHWTSDLLASVYRQV